MEKKEPFFDEELADIIRNRAVSRCMKMSVFLIKNFQNELITANDVLSAIENFVSDEIHVRLIKEVDKYAKRNHPHDYRSDIDKARIGNRESLCRIIAWDKAWLFMPWVKEKILEAQEDMDMKLIKSIGAAVSREPGVKTVVNAADKENRQEIIKFMTWAISLFHQNFRDENMNKIIDISHTSLLNSGIIPDELTDIKEFKRTLRRHNVI